MLQQQSDAWLQWRGKGIGSSDAPVILGTSPYRTVYDLWLEKTGHPDFVKQEQNFAMSRGVTLEPIARAQYELMNDIDMPPAVVESAEYPWLRASLDGYSKDLGIVLEIKYVGAEDWALALEGKVPDRYRWQLTHQAMLTGANTVHYYSFDGTKGHLVVFHPNKEDMERLFVEELKFWELVISKTPPPLSDKDYKNIRNETLSELLDLYQAQKKAIKETECSMENTKKIILEYCEDHPRIRCGDYRIQRIERKGSVDFSKIPVLKGIDLEPFRKKAVFFYDIRKQEKKVESRSPSDD